jgi:hypothetical protein
MRTSIYDFIESDEQKAALRRVLDWWREDCGWSKDLPKRAPKIIGDGDGALNGFEVTSVTPPPSSLEPRYNALGQSCGLNSKGKKAKHGYRPAKTCADCPVPIERGKRCVACNKLARYKRHNVKRVEDRKAARLAIVDGAVVEIAEVAL